MKIKLINLPFYNTSVNTDQPIFSGYFIPLGIATQKAILMKEGFTVEQDDLHAKVHDFNKKNRKNTIDISLFADKRRVLSYIIKKADDIFEQIGNKILRLTHIKNFDIIAFALNEWNNPSSFGILTVLSKLIKELSNPIIIVGGHIPDNIQNSIVKNGIADYVIAEHKSGQKYFLKLCQSLKSKSDIKNVSGIIYYNSGKIIRTPLNNYPIDFIRPNFGDLPLDIYRRTVTIQKENEEIKKEILALPYFFVLGCPSKCAFCSNASSNYFFVNSPEKVIEDIEFLRDKYNTEFFYFMNTAINPNYKYAKNLIKSFIEKDLNIYWTDCANFRYLDKKLFKDFSKAGATRLIFGLETASPRLQQYIGKNLDLNKAQYLLKYSSHLDLQVDIELIPGLPYENLQDIKLSKKFIIENVKYVKEFHIFKFWLDGLFSLNPEKFGLTIPKKEEFDITRVGNCTPFNEAKGLQWKEKMDQINISYNHLYDSLKLFKHLYKKKLTNINKQIYAHYLNHFHET